MLLFLGTLKLEGAQLQEVGADEGAPPRALSPRVRHPSWLKSTLSRPQADSSSPPTTPSPARCPPSSDPLLPFCSWHCQKAGKQLYCKEFPHPSNPVHDKIKAVSQEPGPCTAVWGERIFGFPLESMSRSLHSLFEHVNVHTVGSCHCVTYNVLNDNAMYAGRRRFCRLKAQAESPELM